jgi:hypothetical protein
MKTIIQKIFIILLLGLFSCSENPIFKDENVSNNSITGKVELSDQLSPDSIFVWFRVLNIGTRTDENGDFRLEIPSPNLQPGKGLDGLYAVYFYAANYVLDSLEIAMSNGSVQISSTEVNDKGELKRHVKLQKLVDITTFIEPPTITQDFQDTVFTTLTLKSYNEDVEVYCNRSVKTFKWDPLFLAGIVVDSTNQFVKYARREDRGLTTVLYNVGTSPVAVYELILKLEPGALVPGEYRIIPYFDIRQDNLPKGLLECLGDDVLTYSPAHLRLPIKINRNSFQVIGG